ncbi:MBL fold metallo-hydrolase, partial [Patescibacteria group bacterium]|nr:MBL fold metallo-hydrolase [Patescibacteria group bacterium]
MRIGKSFESGVTEEEKHQDDEFSGLDLEQLSNDPERCAEMGLDSAQVQEVLQTTYRLSDEELPVMIDEYQVLDSSDPIDNVRLAALSDELAKRQRVESAFEGNDRVEKLRDNMWLLRKEGSTNPVSVVFRKGSDLFVTDPGISWKSKGKNKDLQQLEEGLGARVKGVMLTHSHPDHIGNIPSVARGDTQIYAHGKALWSLLSPDKLLRAENVWAKKAKQSRGKSKKEAEENPPFPGWQTKAYPLYARAVYGPNMTGIKKESKTEDEQGYKRLPKDPMKFDGYSVEAVHTPGHVPGESGFWVPEDKIF